MIRYCANELEILKLDVKRISSPTQMSVYEDEEGFTYFSNQLFRSRKLAEDHIRASVRSQTNELLKQIQSLQDQLFELSKSPFFRISPPNLDFNFEVFRLCEHCNREYKVRLVGFPQDFGSCWDDCPHCGIRDDVWISIRPKP